MATNIFFSAGEPSGDHHAAALVTQLRRVAPDIAVRGLGGPAMRSAGCRLDCDLTQHAVMGLMEVLPKLRQFFRIADHAEEIFRGGDIDAVVLVDFPGFNWHIAKRAKRYGIPVHYYCPPQLWAWGGWRIGKMRRSVDHVLAVLPIEQQYYSQRGVPSTYVGHPFFDAVAEQPLDRHLLDRFQSLSAGGHPLVAVLPGSRDHEVRRNWPLMLQAIRRIHVRHRDARFLVASYRDRQCLWCRDHLSAGDASLPIDFYVGRTSEIIEAARCAMMVSGSVSLEMMARRTPAAVLYRAGRVMYSIGKLVVRLPSITLPNLMAGRMLFPEMISVGRAEPAIDFLTESMTAMLADPFYYQQTRDQIDALARRHAQGGASARAADVLCQRLGLGRPAAIAPAPQRRAA